MRPSRRAACLPSHAPRLSSLAPLTHALFQVLRVDQPLDGRILARLLGLAHGGGEARSGRRKKRGNGERAKQKLRNRPTLTEWCKEVARARSWARPRPRSRIRRACLLPGALVPRASTRADGAQPTDSASFVLCFFPAAAARLSFSLQLAALGHDLPHLCQGPAQVRR